MKPPVTLLHRIYRLKLLAIGALLVLAGLLLSFLSDAVGRAGASHVLVAILNHLADALVVTGGLGIAIDFFTGRAKDEAVTDRTRAVIKDLIPDFTDAVVQGFAVQPDDLKRVATPDLLDQIATNALGLRLGDQQFAAEVYADVRDLAIRAPERWYDVDVSIRLSSVDKSGGRGADLLEVLITWEYTVTPQDSVRRIACTSDMDEFHELVRDIPTTSTWFMSPRPGIDPAERASFELLTFSVDGDECRPRRSERRAGQVYTVDIGDEIAKSGQPVRIRHTYRAVTDRTNHRLFLAIAQPARDVHVDLDYSAADISRMSVSDLVPSSRRPYVSQLPAQASGKELTIEVPGWLQAGTGFTFVWTNASEETPAARRGRPTPPAAAA
jgi:hypothetical protein